MAVLVLLETDATGVKQPSRAAVTAAVQLGEVHALVIGAAAAAAAAAAVPHVARVLHAGGEVYAHGLAEPLAALLAHLAPRYTHILAASTAAGKNALPRAAALIDAQPIGDVSAIIDADTFVRPIYAGNALATVRSADPVKVLTIRAASFDPVAAERGDAPAPVEAAPDVAVPVGARYVGAELSRSERPELTAARVVVSGGRGMQNGANFSLLDPIADSLGAAVGASRAAVDAGFVPNDRQVGQTGKIVAPELYMAIGISGAIQHLAGMKDSRVIVAINKDADAPIFQVADYGLVADLFTALPELAAELAKLPEVAA